MVSGDFSTIAHRSNGFCLSNRLQCKNVLKSCEIEKGGIEYDRCVRTARKGGAFECGDQSKISSNDFTARSPNEAIASI